MDWRHRDEAARARELGLNEDHNHIQLDDYRVRMPESHLTNILE